MRIKYPNLTARLRDWLQTWDGHDTYPDKLQRVVNKLEQGQEVNKKDRELIGFHLGQMKQ